MKDAIGIVIALMLGILVSPSTAWSQDDMVVVDNAIFGNPQRTASVFVHDDHNDAAEIDDCAECHHVYEDGQRVEDASSEDQSCSECHDLEGSNDQPSLIKAFHLNCKGCHQAQNKGPIMCGECHIK